MCQLCTCGETRYSHTLSLQPLYIMFNPDILLLELFLDIAMQVPNDELYNGFYGQSYALAKNWR